MAARPNSTKLRRICWDKWKFDDPPRMKCYRCPTLVGPSLGEWEADHLIPIADGGGDGLDGENLYPCCIPCHREKTKADVKWIAKGKRVRDKHLGLRQSKRPMPGSKRSRFRKRMDGTVEER